MTVPTVWLKQKNRKWLHYMQNIKKYIKSLLFNQLLIHISDVVDEYIYVFDI